MKNHIVSKRHAEMLIMALGADIIGFLEDVSVTEVMLNSDGRLWVEKYDEGKIFSGIFIEKERAANIIKLLAAMQQKIINHACPELACEIEEFGVRFQGWFPPVVKAATFSMRKVASRIFSLNDYRASAAITEKQAEQVRLAIKERKNILIAGGSGSGKTTFANALLHELELSLDRIIILEDLPELQIKAKNCVRLISNENVSMRSLVKSAMRMRPDRIIVGEVRDGSALELLKAWNTGHPGGICTVHANSCGSALARLEDLAHEAAGAIPVRLVSEAINLVIFMRNHSVAAIEEFE